MAEENSVAIVAIVIVAIVLVLGAVLFYRHALFGTGTRIVEATTTIIEDTEPIIKERETIRENKTTIREIKNITTIVQVPLNVSVI